MAYERKEHDSFILHDDQMQLITALPDADAGKLMKEIIAAHFAENAGEDYTPQLEGFPAAVYGIIRKQHAYETEKYLRKCRINRENVMRLKEAVTAKNNNG